MTAGQWRWPMFGVTALALVVFSLFPHLDLWISGLFYDLPERFAFNRSPLGRFVLKGVPALLTGALAYTVILWLAGVYYRQRFFGIDGRMILFLSASLTLGPGLIVNSVLKEFWGRARPAQTTSFGGDALFTPALLPTNQCDSNCSFVAGHAAFAFWTLAFALMVPPPWRRGAVAGSLLFGLAIGLSRIAQGKHFTSDVLFAGVITCTVVLILHDWLYGAARPR